MYPEKEIKVANAEGLKECKKLLQLAKAGKYNGHLLALDRGARAGVWQAPERCSR